MGVNSLLITGLIGLCLTLLGGLRVYLDCKKAWASRVTEEQRLEAAKHKKIMQQLVETEGWKFLEAAAKVQSTSRQNEIMLKPTENPLLQEYCKGEVQGIELFLRLPKNLIESSKAILEAYAEQDE